MFLVIYCYKISRIRYNGTILLFDDLIQTSIFAHQYIDILDLLVYLLLEFEYGVLHVVDLSLLGQLIDGLVEILIFVDKWLLGCELRRLCGIEIRVLTVGHPGLTRPISNYIVFESEEFLVAETLGTIWDYMMMSFCFVHGCVSDHVLSCRFILIMG